MTEYGIATRNKFAFLEEDASDPEEVLIKTKDAKKAEAKAPIQTKKTLTAATSEAKTVAAQKEDNNFPQKQKVTNEKVEGDRSQNNYRGGPRRFQRDGNQNMGDRRPFNKDRPPFNKDRPPRQQVQGGDENAPPRERQQVGDGHRGPREGDRFPNGNRPPRRQYNRDGEHNGEMRGSTRRDYQNRESGDNRRDYQNRENSDNRRDNQFREDGGYRRNQNRDGGVYRRPFREGDHRRGNQEENPNNNVDTQSEEINGAIPQKVDTDKTLNNEADLGNGNFDSGWEEKPEDDSNVNEEKSDGKTTEEQPPEPKVIVKTLEEWKSEQKKNEQQFNLRKPGEGADQKVYQKLQPIKRETREKEQDTDDDEHHYKEKREKPLNIEIQFNDPKREREQRFNRDRGEGNRNEREQRPNRGDGAQGDDRGARPPQSSNRVQYRDANRGNTYKGQKQGAGSHRKTEFNIESEQFPALGPTKQP